MGRRKTLEQFIKEARNIHGDKYDYSIVDYNNSKTKIKIICSEHGVFEQSPIKHLCGRGCNDCANINRRFKKSSNSEIFIDKSNRIHNHLYDYQLVNYIKSDIKVDIICKKHGVFKQTPNSHLSGSGCPICNKNKSNNIDFIKKSNLIHNNYYNYYLVDYKGTHKKVKIICPKHGMFEQTPHHHLHGCGCPKCNESKGEKNIRNFLDNKNIKYFIQYKFNDCVNIKKLKFDFYLPKHNICIEFDGKQHYKSVKWFGGDKTLKYIQQNDNIKNEYCIKNNIRLLRIKYNDNIELLLNKYLNF